MEKRVASLALLVAATGVAAYALGRYARRRDEALAVRFFRLGQ